MWEPAADVRLSDILAGTPRTSVHHANRFFSFRSPGGLLRLRGEIDVGDELLQ